MGVVLAVLSGGLTALAFPPTDWSALVWVSLVPLLIAVEKCHGPRRATALGAVSGLIFGLVVLSPLRSGHLWAGWAAIPLADLESVQQGHARFLTALWMVASLWMAVVWGCFAAGVKRIAATGSLLVFIVLPLLWILIPEYVRSLASGGFHWAMLGNAAAAVPQIRQLAAVGGVWMLSALVILVNLAIAAGIVAPKELRTWDSVGAVAALMVVAVLWGQWRLSSLERAEPYIGVVAVQPGVPGNPSAVALETGLDPTILAMVGTAVQRLEGRFQLLVLPESSTLGALSLDTTVAAGRPTELQHEPGAWESIFSRLLSGRDIALAIGTDTVERGRVFNSMVAFTSRGVAGRYHKRRLVPFAESTPRWWPGGPRGELQYSPGADPHPISANGLDLGALVCQEVLFPSLVRKSVRAGATILVSGGNDGVFASRAVAEVNARAAQLRAVESGRYFVRAMKTGVTAVIDPTGAEIARSESDEPTVLLANVEPRESLTLYSRLGDWVVLAAAICSIVVFLVVGRRAERNSQDFRTSLS
jgi:apolipoprotein N-acyltransferase